MLKILAFLLLIFPTIHQALSGFRTQDKQLLKKISWRSAFMQLFSIFIAYFIFLKSGVENPMLVAYTGITFLLSVGLLVLIQYLRIYLKENKS